MVKDIYSYISEDISLKVGEKTKIKSGFLTALTLIYSGMISKEIFSISIIYGTGHQGFSYSLFYQKDTKSINIGNEKFSIVEVSSDKLILRKFE